VTIEDGRSEEKQMCLISWFGPVASAGEAMVWESVTDGNPSVDADESNLPMSIMINAAFFGNGFIRAIDRFLHLLFLCFARRDALRYRKG